ncbi:MAG TPA: hypothetical protein V6D19_08710 [Stenomitos sp.]
MTGAPCKPVDQTQRRLHYGAIARSQQLDQAISPLFLQFKAMTEMHVIGFGCCD